MHLYEQFILHATRKGRVLIKLRDYQEKSHELIINNFKQQLAVLLVVMAGGGKSITAGSFIAKYHHHFKFVLISVNNRGVAIRSASIGVSA